MKSFCGACGKEEVEEWTGRYCRVKGEKLMRDICPDKPCEHSGHLWEHRPMTFWQVLKNEKTLECSRCQARSWGLGDW